MRLYKLSEVPIRADDTVFKVPLLGTAALLLLASLCVGKMAAAPAKDAADRFYALETVQTIHLEVKPEDLKRLEQALPERIYVPATFRWNDQVFTNVGLRYKGNSSSNPDLHHKRGYLLSFTEFQKGQRFLGLRHVALDNGIQFGSLFSEPLITEALRGLDVKASRCNYAQVYLNGRSIGIYVNVERIDQSFLERHFGFNRGVLFKVDEAGPGTDLSYAGDDPLIYRKSFEVHVGKENQAFRYLLEFIRTLNAPEGTTDWRQCVDLDAFLKTTAVLLFAGAFDQYTGWNPHNYYLYRDPIEQRWTYIPWDLDVGFADNAFGRVPVLEGWHAAWPAPAPGRPLLERIISDPMLLERYRKQAGTVLETWFRPEVLIPKLRALHERIRPALEEDPFPPRRATVPSDSGYQDILSSMETFIRKRYALARAQLDAPGQRPQFKQMSPPLVQEGPSPGPPSADAPSDLRAFSVTAVGVELRWTDHAPGAAVFVVQRCVGAQSADFANYIGQSAQSGTTAVDREVRPGMTYRYRVYAVRPTPEGPRGTGVSNVVTVTIPGEGKG